MSVKVRLFVLIIFVVFLINSSFILADFRKHIVSDTLGGNALSLGDIDNDGDIDIAIARDTHGFDNLGTNFWFENDGNGLFQINYLDPVVNYQEDTNDVYVADIKYGGDYGNGCLDIMVANSDGEYDYLYVQGYSVANGCEGTFTKVQIFGPLSGQCSSQNFESEAITGGALSKIGGHSGNRYIVVGNLDCYDLVYKWEPTTDTFSVFTLQSSPSQITYTRDLFLEDVDGDAYIDIFEGTGEFPINNFNYLYKNHGNNYFNIAERIQLSGSSGDTHGVFISDIDGDTDLDLFEANYGQNYWYQNAGALVFNRLLLHSDDYDSSSIAVGNLFGDSNKEYAVGNRINRYYFDPSGNPAGQRNFVYSGNVVSGFTPEVLDYTFDKTTDLAFGDIDKDGDLDIVVVNYYNGGVYWYEYDAGFTLPVEDEICDTLDNDGNGLCQNGITECYYDSDCTGIGDGVCLLIDEGCDDDKDHFPDEDIECVGSFYDGYGVEQLCAYISWEGTTLCFDPAGGDDCLDCNDLDPDLTTDCSGGPLPVCGDGAVESPETCDCGSNPPWDCSSLSCPPGYSGTLGCNEPETPNQCTLIDNCVDDDPGVPPGGGPGTNVVYGECVCNDPDGCPDGVGTVDVTIYPSGLVFAQECFLAEEKVPFMSNFAIAIVVLLLIGFYVFDRKRRKV